MAKWVHDDVLDQALSYIQNNCSKMTVCSQQPTTYDEATSTYALADVAMSDTDFTVADGDSSGRKVTVGQKSDVTVDSSGDATHVALVDDTNSKLLYVTTCTTQTLTSGNTVTFPAWDIELADPS